jgi:hypothetical protein
MDKAELEYAYWLLTIGDWTVSRASLFDEEGVEGWKWTGPRGQEHCAIGDWREVPPLPDSLTPPASSASR